MNISANYTNKNTVAFKGYSQSFTTKDLETTVIKQKSFLTQKHGTHAKSTDRHEIILANQIKSMNDHLDSKTVLDIVESIKKRYEKDTFADVHLSLGSDYQRNNYILAEVKPSEKTQKLFDEADKNKKRKYSYAKNLCGELTDPGYFIKRAIGKQYSKIRRKYNAIIKNLQPK